MKRLIFLSIIYIIFVFSGYSQDIILEPLGDDLSQLFISIGRDLTPIIRQNTISSDTFGEAEIDKSNFPFYLTISSLSISSGDGVATVLSNEYATWDFLIKLPTLVDSSLDSEETKEYYDVSQNVFALPSLNLSFGISLPKNIELHLRGIYLPTLDYSMFNEALGNLKLNITDFTIKVRKVLISDNKFRPAFSVGLAYSYSSFLLDYKINSLTDILDDTFDLGAFGKLDLVGDFNMESQFHIISMDYHISKKLLFFTPFIKFTPNIYFTSFQSNADFDATVYSEDMNTINTTANLDPSAKVETNGFSLMCTTGFEIKIFYVVLHFGATFDLQNPVVVIGNGLDDTYLDKVSLNFAFRLQF